MRAAIRNFVVAWAFGLAFVSFHCAVQIPPGGGPRDLAPPIIVESSPASGMLNFHERVLSVTFDKYVDKRAVQDAFFISPALRGHPEFDWSGRRFTVTLPESLRTNTTYTISLGTDVYEVRENVHLATPFALSFSTGPVLDSARITGKVFCDNNAGVFVFAYNTAGRLIDTLNPTHTQPDYLAPVSKDSTFTIPALPFGTFRLFAIKDEQRNLVYDVGSDGYAAARTDATLNIEHQTDSDVVFRIGPPRDTVPPELTSADALATTHVRATFSEPLDSMLYATTRFTVRDSQSHTPVIVRAVTPSAKRTSVDLYLDALTPDALYLCSVDSLRDLAGNMMRRNTVVFTANAVHDTTPPVVVWPMRDSTIDINEGRFVFTFDEPVQHKLAENAIKLSDSMHAEIPLRFRWPNDAVMAVYDDHMRENQWYTLTVTEQYFADPMNNHTKDSVMRIHFRTRDPRTLGILKGTVEDTANARHSSYYVTAHNITTRKSVTRRVGDAGTFTLDDLPDGTYTVDAFRDDDDNGVLSAGDIYPYRFAEPYAAVPGTFRVRARWTVEGVKIPF